MSLDWFSVLVGGILGLLTAVIGGWAQSWASDYFQRKRAADDERKRWLQLARNWATQGRRDSLRRADLRGADLREVDLGSAEEHGKGVDLSYSILTGADLSGANLRGAKLKGADLRGAKLCNATLDNVNLDDADLRGADLQDARLDAVSLYGTDLRGANFEVALVRAVCNNATRWPKKVSLSPDYQLYDILDIFNTEEANQELEFERRMERERRTLSRL